jgi:polyhydroxybutyrate depolymerase
MPPRPAGPLPLLLAFHGGGGNAGQFQATAGLDRVADSAGFVVVYPNGTGPLRRRLLTWNAGPACCGYAQANALDDVGFVAAVIEDVARRTAVDRSRVYVTGHSNGGMMAHRVAAERADLVAAAASVAGSLNLERITPSRPVAVLQIHSVDDPRALYDGGLGPPFPGTDNRVQHGSVQAGLDRWIAANGCSTVLDTVDIRSDLGGAQAVEQTATLLIWRGCRGGTEVGHWRLTGAGHGWPGDAASAGGEALVGPQARVVNAADEVWHFVSRFRRSD